MKFNIFLPLFFFAFLGEAKLKQEDLSKGFKIQSIKKDSFYEKAGLKKGDIIKAYNGRSVLNVDEALAMYKDLRLGKVKTLTIIRKGEKKVYRFK